MWWKCDNVPSVGLYDVLQQNEILHVERFHANHVRVKFLSAERVVSALEVNCGELPLKKQMNKLLLLLGNNFKTALPYGLCIHK